MVKRVKVEQLKPGMFISDLNCGWLRHPFVTNNMKLKKDATIEKIISYGIREVYIDTAKGLDVTDAPTEKDVHQEIQREINKVIEKEKKNTDRVSLQEEIIKAKDIKNEARDIIQNLIENVKADKPIEMGGVENIVVKIVNSIFRNQDALMSLSRIRKKDIYTYAHSISVCVHMVSFGKYLGYDARLMNDLGIGALLHDIGKIKVPVEILNKTNSLSDQEYIMIKEHVEFGTKILEQTGTVTETAIATACQHHERLDGTGYPRGLKGDAITEYGQAMGIVDVYDAITSDRCYKLRIEPTHALKKLFEWSKYHFNNTLVQKFIRCTGIYPVGTLVVMESGWIGVVIKQGEKSLLHPVIRLIYNKKTENYLRVPQEVDLADPSGKYAEDSIIDCESADKWNLQPEMYL